MISPSKIAVFFKNSIPLVRFAPNLANNYVDSFLFGGEFRVKPGYIIVTELEINSAVYPYGDCSPAEIEFLGNLILGWKLSKDSVIRRIENSHNSFVAYDHMRQKMLQIVVVKSAEGNKGLATFDAGRTWNTLHGLPKCDKCTLID